MASNRLHLISFDIPFPADYGGVMDVFYKIKALHEAGIHVVLHCFQYRERTPQAELKKYCAEVHYYPRDLSPLSMLSPQPFIVHSRTSAALLKNLLKDDAPILFEGLHACAYIGEKRLHNRLKIVRMHNVEWEYYRNLKALESRFWKKLYFSVESKKLQSFEYQILKNADILLTISPDDTAYFEEKIEKQAFAKPPSVVYIPPFHPNTMVESKIGTGDYVLFHGKLSVSDNEEAAIYLIKKVFARRDIPFIVAGKDPSERLLQLAKQHENVTIRPNPTDAEMVDLIQNAQINVLLSFQRAGMKLKLLNALYRGRHCVVNRHTVQNTGLESLCYVKNTSRDIRALVESLMNVQMSSKQIAERKTILERDFSNKINAAKIVDLLS
jgi:5S rRNA maturation endonuclease (ribonuclease M5)